MVVFPGSRTPALQTVKRMGRQRNGWAKGPRVKTTGLPQREKKTAEILQKLEDGF